VPAYVQIQDGDATPLVASPQECQLALTRALAFMLKRAHPLPSQQPRQFSLVCGAFPEFSVARVAEQDLVAQLSSGIFAEALQKPQGVLLFVMSMLLSRGLERVRGEMDDSSMPFVGRFGHSTQELVNLMIAGEAVSNVFDGNKQVLQAILRRTDCGTDVLMLAPQLGDRVDDASAFFLHGISAPQEIGYLTLLEAMRYCKVRGCADHAGSQLFVCHISPGLVCASMDQVGNFYKNPKNPIWVIGSATHYTVAFSVNANLTRVSQQDEFTNKLRVHFQQLDPHEQGFVPSAELGMLFF